MEFLLIVFVLSVVGGIAVLIRHRRPSGMKASIDEFEQNLNAIAPPQGDERTRRGARRSG